MQTKQATPVDRAQASDLTETLPFRVSAGLKRIIGRDLITNPFVAIFELVKNSYDSYASMVQLVFLDDTIHVIDDGKGMSRKGLKERWLFVAYSAKRDGTEDAELGGRAGHQQLIGRQRAFAGSKGVGRFSCDRLGGNLVLQTRSEPGGMVERLTVNWDEFENDDSREFYEVPVTVQSQKNFDMPRSGGSSVLEMGTILTITRLRTEQEWDRRQLLALKAALAKLIDPHKNQGNEFSIVLDVPSELAKDTGELGGVDPRENPPSEPAYHNVVNGYVRNFIFDTLKTKTTFVSVAFSEEGNTLETKLVDRGELIYHLREPNTDFPALTDARFSCEIFFLNRSAKATFARRMGVPSVQFGSIFLFKNGFSIYPIGKEKDDTFGIDRRKQQSYARYLGTRDIIGRVDVYGNDEVFRESSSRDTGLIRTEAYDQLERCLREKALRRLEKYVVDVTWIDASDKDRETVDGLLTDDGKTRVAEVVAQLAASKDVEVLATSPRLIQLIDERASAFAKNLKAIAAIANRTDNQSLLKAVAKAEKRYEKLARAEQAAREAADEAVRGRADAEEQARRKGELAEEEASKREKAERAAGVFESAYEEEKKRNLFLASLSSMDQEAIQDLHHHAGVNASTIRQRTRTLLRRIKMGKTISTEELETFLLKNDLLAGKIVVITQIATKARFRMQTDNVTADLLAYCIDYVLEICPIYAGDGIEITVENSIDSFERTFKPLEIGIVFDNLVSNARKAHAGSMVFRFGSDDSQLIISASDDGHGFDSSLVEPSRIFERGVSTTDGAGLGLAHVQTIVQQMGGDIKAEANTPARGLTFRIRIPK